MSVRQNITIVHKYVITLLDHIFVLVEMDTSILGMENVKVIKLFTKAKALTVQ